MDSQPASSARPLSVKCSCLIFLVGSVLGDTVVSTHGRSNRPVELFIRFWVISILSGLTLVPVWFAFRGKSWGRWFMLALQLLASFYFVHGLRRYQARWPNELWFYYTNSIAQLIATVLLFMPSANRWFKLQRSMSRVPPVLSKIQWQMRGE